MNAERQIEGEDIETQTTQTLEGFNRAYAKYFGDLPPPTRSTVCSALMEPSALIEIEVLAYIGERINTCVRFPGAAM